jgi:hypothetical protein
MKLTDADFYRLRHAYVGWLNKYVTDNGLEDDPLTDNYVIDHEVLLDYTDWLNDRIIVVTFVTDDDGGPATLMIHTGIDDVDNIEFACSIFDTSTKVWVGRR